MIIEIEANCFNCIHAHIGLNKAYCDLTEGELAGFCEEYEPEPVFEPEDLLKGGYYAKGNHGW